MISDNPDNVTHFNLLTSSGNKKKSRVVLNDYSQTKAMLINEEEQVKQNSLSTSGSFFRDKTETSNRALSGESKKLVKSGHKFVGSAVKLVSEVAKQQLP